MCGCNRPLRGPHPGLLLCVFVVVVAAQFDHKTLFDPTHQFHSGSISGLPQVAAPSHPQGSTVSRSELLVKNILAQALRRITKQNEHAVLSSFVKGLYLYDIHSVRGGAGAR